MDNHQLQSAALRQHSYNLNLMAAAVAHATNAATIPFLSAAGMMPSPTAAFVNLPMTAGPSTGTLEQFAAQSIMYPSAYLTAAQSSAASNQACTLLCSCACAAQPCVLHHRYTTPAILAASSLAASAQRLNSLPQQHSSSAALANSLAASNVNVNIPPPVAQLPPAALNLPSLPPTLSAPMRSSGSSRTLKRPAPYSTNTHTTSSNSSQQSTNTSSNLQSSAQDGASSTSFRGPKLRRVASFDDSNESHMQSGTDSSTSRPVAPIATVSSASLFNPNQTTDDLVAVAASLEGVLQSAQALPTTYPSCTICASCQNRVPPCHLSLSHHHHHCHHCPVCSANVTPNYGSNAPGSSATSFLSNMAANQQNAQQSSTYSKLVL